MPLLERPCHAGHGLAVLALPTLAREQCHLAPVTLQFALARLRDKLRRVGVPKLANHLALENGTFTAIHTASFTRQRTFFAILLVGTVPN